MSTEAKYRAKVLNVDGYVLMYPNVSSDVPKLTMPPNPYAQSITQLFPLGTKLIQGERVWRYCKNAANTVAIAAPLQSPAALHSSMNYDIVVADNLGIIGATTVNLTSTANLATAPLSSKDGIAEGYLFVNDLAGEGQMYKIKGHAALASTCNALFTLYDPLTIAVTTSSQVGLIQNPYANVVVTAAVLTGMFVGVPLLAITSSYYFWSQTGGPAPVVAHAAVALGTKVIVGTTAAKSDPSSAATAEVVIGYPLVPHVTDTETYAVFLTGDR